jgi:hypothetical protein
MQANANPGVLDVFCAQHAPWFNRARRILFVLFAVWLMHMLDLRFTLAESAKGHFHELNPFAAFILDWSHFGVVLYKVLLLGGATAILWYLRRYAISERASWLLLFMAIGLTIRWQMYFQLAPEQPFNYLPPPLAASM